MEVYLIRHTAPLIKKGLIYGRMDVPLSASFSEERDILLKQLTLPLDAVYSSPATRCYILAGFIQADYLIEADLCEMNFGDWEGKTWDTINRHDSELWMNDFVQLAPPNGESMVLMQQRVMQCWNRIIGNKHKRIAVVTHGGVIRIILAHYRAIALKDSFDIKVGFAEVFKLSVSNG